MRVFDAWKDGLRGEPCLALPEPAFRVKVSPVLQIDSRVLCGYSDDPCGASHRGDVTVSDSESEERRDSECYLPVT